MNKTNLRRRQLMLGIALSPMAGMLTSGEVFAQDLPHLDLEDPVAKALKYVHDASTAERPDKQGVAGAQQNCSNCQFVQGADGDAWRPCMLFPGKAVNANGWCANWTKKA